MVTWLVRRTSCMQFSDVVCKEINVCFSGYKLTVNNFTCRSFRYLYIFLNILREIIR